MRFAKFATVGGIGFVLQLATFMFLTASGWPYLLAAATSVELAALHNFCWHERWTWTDRERSPDTLGRRIVGYHLTTAAIAVAGNVILTGALVELLDAPPLLASVASVALLAAANFAVADCWVFASRSVEDACVSRRAPER